VITKAHLVNGEEDYFGELIYTNGSEFGISGRKRSRTAMEMGESYKLVSRSLVPGVGRGAK
jgi:hypothetical protein